MEFSDEGGIVDNTNKKIEVDTRLGKLSAEVCDDPDHPGLTVYWEGAQIAVIEPSTPLDTVRVLLWDRGQENPFSETEVV